MSRVGFRVDALVATRDPRGNGIVVTGWEPGPAGVAVLDLRGGDAVLVADVAEPDLLVSLQLPELAGEDSQRIADTVLGAGVINELRQLRGDGTPAVVWRRQDQARRTVIGQGGLGLIGRLAVGLAEITAADRSEAAIAIGLVEAGVGAVLLDREISPSPSGLDLVRAGVARWEDLPPFAFDGLGMPTVDRLTAEAQRWAATVGTLDDRLGAALERLAIRLRGRFGPDVAAAGAVGGARPTSAPPPPPLRARPRCAGWARRRSCPRPQPRRRRPMPCGPRRRGCPRWRLRSMAALPRVRTFASSRPSWTAITSPCMSADFASPVDRGSGSSRTTGLRATTGLRVTATGRPCWHWRPSTDRVVRGVRPWRWSRLTSPVRTGCWSMSRTSRRDRGAHRRRVRPSPQLRWVQSRLVQPVVVRGTRPIAGAPAVMHGSGSATRVAPVWRPRTQGVARSTPVVVCSSTSSEAGGRSAKGRPPPVAGLDVGHRRGANSP